jgi:endopeptidase La
MFPMTFEYRVLENLPLQDKDGTVRVQQILYAILLRRVVPYFRSRRGTDPTLIARVIDHLNIHRLEDEEERISVVSLISRKDARWTLHIHERVFDYLAFVIPSDPDSHLGGGTPEEGKMLAYAEFMLRHQAEHMLYSQKTERELIRSDVVFAMDRRANDPTFYRMLRNALADELNGLKGAPCLTLFDSAEKEQPYEYLITRLLTPFVAFLADLPDESLEEVFPLLDKDLKTKVLGEFYRRSRETSYSLIRRNAFLYHVPKLLRLTLKENEKEAEEIFNAFKDQWGLFYLFHELDLPQTSMEDKDSRELFEFFKENLNRFFGDAKEPFAPAELTPKPRAELQPLPPPAKSLNDRIEEARNDPLFSRQALQLIDRNKLNAVGHSGSKYTELIDTLLAIPWGKIRKIGVSPEAFEKGLNRSHYGLDRPKEIICDFFTNLIWRYKNMSTAVEADLKRTGSAFLFVGPPGVGKTSLAISIAENLGIRYHKVSLGGMRDEADLKGHGFTYEGSKPGAIVQGLIKMGIMNGMFIMDETDKTEKFAIATLLEILDPEQNHLFHDRYTESTLDIDLSNCHFILTANTLETVPPAVINRCEVVFLDRYSVEEKIAIAQQHLIRRVRQRYQISEKDIFFEPTEEAGLLRHLIKTYAHEAGVRELERVIRTLFLRILRKEILAKGARGVRITRQKIKQYLEQPSPPRRINDEDRVGEMLALGVDVERGIGSIIPVQATSIRLGPGMETPQRSYLSMVHATGNIQTIMDESRKVATTGILHCAEALGIKPEEFHESIHLHFMGASTRKDGPSAGGAIALALASAFSRHSIRRDVAMTGEIDTQGRITSVGGLYLKLKTAYDAGCKTLIIPRENLIGEEGIERLPESLKKELQILTFEEWKGDHVPFDYEHHILQVVAVDHIAQAAEIAFIHEEEIRSVEKSLVSHGVRIAIALKETRRDSESCLLLLYLKDQRDLDEEGLRGMRWEGCKTFFLQPPEVRKAVLERFPHLERCVQFRNFDPSKETLTLVVQEIEKSFQGKTRFRPALSVVAPFFFLKRAGLLLEGLSPRLDPDRSRFFANIFTLQALKIKICKPILNRVYAYLAQLASGHLDACPFLAKRDGIYTVDLSFIPEKYRLDQKRAEDILTRCLKEWLIAVETGLQERGERR